MGRGEILVFSSYPSLHVLPPSAMPDAVDVNV